MNTIITTTTNNALVAAHISAITTKTGSAYMGMSKALLIEEAKRQMRNGVCHFIYLKKNGEVQLEIYYGPDLEKKMKDRKQELN